MSHFQNLFESRDRIITNTSPFIIAEAGTAHGGNIEKAFDLIDAASEAGAHCVKFQHVYASEIIHPKTGEVPLPGGSIPLFSRFKEVEQTIEFFARLKEHCQKRDVVFLCSPFGPKSAHELYTLGIEAIKIASPELNYDELLEIAAQHDVPVLLSSGVSTLSDIDRALGILRDSRVVLLHCITAYPAPEEEYNLNLIASLHAITGVPCGISDHSLDPILVPCLSVAKGARVIEKHLCLSKKDDGLDDPIALEPDQFNAMVRSITNVCELEESEIIRQLGHEYGVDRITSILGNGNKRLAQSEAANYGRTNRSIHALETIEPGTVFTKANTAVLRTEKILRPGLPPRYQSVVLGRRARRLVEAGEGILWEDLGDIAPIKLD